MMAASFLHSERRFFDLTRRLCYLPPWLLVQPSLPFINRLRALFRRPAQLVYPLANVSTIIKRVHRGCYGLS